MEQLPAARPPRRPPAPLDEVPGTGETHLVTVWADTGPESAGEVLVDMVVIDAALDDD